MGTVAVAVDLAAVATAANDDLSPATGAHKQTACGRHRQTPSMPMRISTGLTVRAILCTHLSPVVRGVGTTPDLTWQFGPVSCLFLRRQAFFYRIRIPASSPSETGRSGCVCTRPSGSFRRTRYPAPTFQKPLDRTRIIPLD